MIFLLRDIKVMYIEVGMGKVGICIGREWNDEEESFIRRVNFGIGRRYGRYRV